MSTALLHHQRSHVIAAGAAVLAVAFVGVGLEISRDSAPTSITTPTSVVPAPLTGGTHEEGNWQHAGTTSGGHVPLEP
jgi:hypothetical protein